MLRWLWVACLLAVMIGSLLPADSEPMVAIDSLGVSDKLEHFGAYGVLAFLPCIHERRRRAILLMTFAAAMGVSLEFGQLFSPDRTFDIYDMLADGIGILVGAVVGLPIRRWLARWLHNNEPQNFAEHQHQPGTSIIHSGK